jgi:hypothetical protein
VRTCRHPDGGVQSAHSHGADDWISIWYDTSSPNGWTTGFDPAKPTVLLMHPPFLDSSWMHFQAEDARLRGRCNILAYDARAAGQTKHIPTGKHDIWTDAADLALFLQVRAGAVPAATWRSQTLSAAAATPAGRPHLRRRSRRLTHCSRLCRAVRPGAALLIARS